MEPLLELCLKRIRADPPSSLKSLPRDLRAAINLERFNQIEFPIRPYDSIFDGLTKRGMTDGEVVFQDEDFEHIGERIPPYKVMGRRYHTYHRGFYYHSLDKYRMVFYHVDYNSIYDGSGVQMKVNMIPEPKIIRRIQALLIPWVRRPVQLTDEENLFYAETQPLNSMISTQNWKWFQ